MTEASGRSSSSGRQRGRGGRGGRGARGRGRGGRGGKEKEKLPTKPQATSEAAASDAANFDLSASAAVFQPGGTHSVVTEPSKQDSLKAKNSGKKGANKSGKKGGDKSSNKQDDGGGANREKPYTGGKQGGKKQKGKGSDKKQKNNERKQLANESKSTGATPLAPSIPPNVPQQTSDINYGKGERIKVLHIAEKPSIGLAIAKGLAKGSFDSGGRSLPVHIFTDPSFPKAPKASKCTHKVTSVAGHVFNVDFPVAVSVMGGGRSGRTV